MRKLYYQSILLIFLLSSIGCNLHKKGDANEVLQVDLFSIFVLKFLVILILTWIMHRVMTMLDKPKKRVLFIFLLGTSFSIYNQADIFWSELSFSGGLINIVGESLNWLLTGYVLSKFVKPKHLGAH